MRILLLDNHDSFTYNLSHLVEKVGGVAPHVYANDAITVSQADEFDAIILSPGPGLPSEAGIMPDLLERTWREKKILGVCLGFQAIGMCFGASLANLNDVCHGVATPITVRAGEPLFSGCPATFLAGRYHSWVIDEATLPDDMVVTARDHQNHIMAARHRSANVCGVQFHPESILSEHGETIVRNWLAM